MRLAARYSSSNACEAEIATDTDVGGPGIIAAFVATAWLTVLIASFNAFYDLRAWLLARRRPQQPTESPGSVQLRQYQTEHNSVISNNADVGDKATLGDTTPDKATPAESVAVDITALNNGALEVLRTQITALLASLCDLQAVTGLAILTAAIARWSTISFYHEALVQDYWDLTLNSFWVARSAYMDPGACSDLDRWRVLLRRCSILASVTLSIVWRVHVALRENSGWRDEVGPCYRYPAGSSPWMWIAGHIITACALASIVLEKTRWIQAAYTELASRWLAALLKRYHSARAGIRTAGIDSKGLSRIWAKGASTSRLALWATAVLAYWLVMIWLDVWAYGDAFYPALWVTYVGLCAWNTFDAFSLISRNKILVAADERGWGFGQVLPLVMLLSVVYSAVDIFRDPKYAAMKRNARRVEGTSQVPGSLADVQITTSTSAVPSSIC